MTFETEVTADSPELWWDTRQAVGASQPDRAGNGHTGTITGSPTLDADGLTFDNLPTGDDEFIVSDDTFTGTFATFAFEVVLRFVAHDYGRVWLAFDDVSSANQSGIHGVSGPLDVVGLSWWDGDPDFQISNDSDGSPIDDDVLHHVICEYDGTNAITYIDGTAVHTTPISSPGIVLPMAQNFTLANDLCNCGDGFIGLLRHGIFYDHDLGPTRAAAHATAALGDDPPEAGPTVSDYPSLALSADFLGGTEDLTDYGREGASIARGTTQASITGFVSDAGTYSTVLDNIDRTFDPNNLSGPFVTAGETDVVPGVPVRAIINWDSVDHPIFRGTADSWPQSYPLWGTDQTVDFRATDAFAFFAGASAEITRPAEKTGARIAAVLAALGYPGVTDIAPGRSFVPALNRGTAVSLSHLADVAQVEWGELYVAGDLDGTFTFRGRDEIATDARSSVSQATFVQQDPDDPYDGLQFNGLTMGSPPIANEVVISYSDTGKQVTLRDDASVAMPWSNGVPKSLSISLPMMTGSQARSYARWLLLLYAYPITTFTSITLTASNAPGATFDLWEQCLIRELGDRITVTVDPLHLSATPPNRPELSGDPITRDCVIRGIQHNLQLPFSTTFYLQDQTWMDNLFIWDTSELDGPDFYGM